MTVEAVQPLAPPSLAAAARVDVELVASGEELAALAGDWRALADAAGAPDPFTSHEWSTAWWQCFGGDSALRVLVARDVASRPLALLPLAAERRRMYGFAVSSLSSTWNPHTPRLDLLARAPAEALCRALWSRIESGLGEWDLLELPQLPAGSPLLEWLPVIATARGYQVETRPGSRSPWVPLDGSWEDYLEGRSHRHRDKLRRCLRRLEGLGRLRLEVVDGEPGLDAALDEGFRLEAAAWKGAAGTAIISRPEVESFYRLLARSAAERGWLELHFLELDGRRIAFDFALRYRDTVFSLKLGYDPAYARCSPGIALIGLAIRNAFERGLRAYDLLGESERWKLSFTDQVREHTWLYVFRPAARARLVQLMKFRVAPHLRGRLWTHSADTPSERENDL